MLGPGTALCSFELGNLAQDVQLKPHREGHIVSNLKGEAGLGGSKITLLNKEEPKYPGLQHYQPRMCLHTQSRLQNKATFEFWPRVMLKTMELISNQLLDEIKLFCFGGLLPLGAVLLPQGKTPSLHSLLLHCKDTVPIGLGSRAVLGAP